MRGISAFRRNCLGADVVSIALQCGIRIPVHRVHAVVAPVVCPSNARRADRERSGNKQPAAIHLRHFELLSRKTIYYICGGRRIASAKRASLLERQALNDEVSLDCLASMSIDL